MLNDPIVMPLVTPSTLGTMRAEVTGVTTGNLLLRTSDVSPGATTRVGLIGADECTLTISHSKSKENAPYNTVRSLVRLNQVRVDTNGKPVTASVYLVTAFPQGGVFNETELLTLVNCLTLFTSFGDVDSTTLSDNSDIMLRILRGEP